MTDPTGQPVRPDGESPVRPPDVDTGFWLWVVAVPLMAAGSIIDSVTAEQPMNGLILAISVVFVVLLSAVVLTFQFLMRQGYRWARTLLTGGGATSVIYVVTNLVSVDRPATAAVVYAVSAIVGSVLIAGGIYLLHRKDVQEFFTR